MTPETRKSAEVAVVVNPSQSGVRDFRAIGLFDQKWKCHDHATRTAMKRPTYRYGMTGPMRNSTPRAAAAWRTLPACLPVHATTSRSSEPGSPGSPRACCYARQVRASFASTRRPSTHSMTSACRAAKSATSAASGRSPGGMSAGTVRVFTLHQGAVAIQSIQPTGSRRWHVGTWRTRHLASVNPARSSGSTASDVRLRCATHSAGDQRRSPGRCVQASRGRVERSEWRRSSAFCRSTTTALSCVSTAAHCSARMSAWL